METLRRGDEASHNHIENVFLEGVHKDIMGYRATKVSDEPLNYFLQRDGKTSVLRVSDVVLRENKDPKEIFAHAIRVATGSKWSHSAIVYLLSNPDRGYENTYLIEAKTKGVHIASWRNEVVPFDQFTVGIKRPSLDWYMETPYEKSRHDLHNPEDVHAISYLRHVRGIAFDQINGLYDHTTVYELTALYAARAARRHLSAVPQVADAAEGIADIFKKWDEDDDEKTDMLRFICSGIVQYSYFEALRLDIMNAFDMPEHREIAEHNLKNLHRIIFRPDPKGLIHEYVHKVQQGKLDIHKPAPEDVLDLLKTATPADFNNNGNLKWHYVVLKGNVWKIDEASNEYVPQNEDEKEILSMITPEHLSDEF